ncbi:MAG: accessory factor UbiK family protein [Hellea sp.]|nr:accessory factor UbiK family protein [Hellea sp.]MDG1666173.1 accessory factor UbiK family protein [Hellea sp.]
MKNKPNPINGFSNLVTNAFGAVKGLEDEVKSLGRSKAESLIAELDLVGREEFEILKTQLFQSNEEIKKLTKELKKLKSLSKK